MKTDIEGKSNVDKVMALRIASIDKFGKAHRDFINEVVAANKKDGDYVGYQLKLKENELIIIQKKGTKTFSIINYSMFPLKGSYEIIKDNMVHYGKGGGVKGQQYVAVAESKDGYWVVLSTPTTDKSVATELSKTALENETGKVVTLEEAKAHKKIVGEEYLEPKFGFGGKFGTLVSRAKSAASTGMAASKKYAGKASVAAKKGYDASKEKVKTEIHNQKKKVALAVIDDTKDKVKTPKEKMALKAAENIVEAKFAKGGNISVGKIGYIVAQFEAPTYMKSKYQVYEYDTDKFITMIEIPGWPAKQLGSKIYETRKEAETKAKREFTKALKTAKENKMAKGGVVGFKKGDKVMTRDGNEETILRKNSNGNYETYENDYSWPPSALTLVSRKPTSKKSKRTYTITDQPAYNSYDKEVGRWYRIYDDRGHLQTLFTRERLGGMGKYSITEVSDRAIAEKFLKQMQEGTHNPDLIVSPGDKFEKGGTISVKELANGNQYTYEEEFGSGSIYREHGIYSVQGFDNGKHFSKGFDKFQEAKSFYSSMKKKATKESTDKMESGGNISGFNYSIGGL